MDVRVIRDLAVMDRFKVLDRFGMHGVRFQDIALGKDSSGIVHRGMSKSCSRERTYAEDASDVKEMEETLSRLSGRVVKDLGRLQFRTVSIKIRYSDFTTITRDCTLYNFSGSADVIERTALRLFRENYAEGRTVRLIGVKLSNLSSDACEQRKLSEFMVPVIA